MDEWRHIYGAFRLDDFQRKGSELLHEMKVLTMARHNSGADGATAQASLAIEVYSFLMYILGEYTYAHTRSQGALGIERRQQWAGSMVKSY